MKELTLSMLEEALEKLHIDMKPFPWMTEEMQREVDRQILLDLQRPDFTIGDFTGKY